MNTNKWLILVLISSVSCISTPNTDVHLLAVNNCFYNDSTPHVFFIGHSYGHHQDTNKSICTPVLNFLDNTVWDSTKAIILGGDIFREASTSAWLDFNSKIDRFNEKIYVAIDNHDLALRDSIDQKYPASFELDPNTQCILMDFETIPYDLSSADVEVLLEYLSKQKYQNHIIVGHKVWWLGQVLHKGADNHNRNDFRSAFWEKVFPEIVGNGSNYYFIAGDLGGNDGIPPLYYRRIKNIHLLGQGIGHASLKSILKIDLESDSLNFLIIDLDTGQEFTLSEDLVSAHKPIDPTSQSRLSKIFRQIKSIVD